MTVHVANYVTAQLYIVAVYLCLLGTPCNEWLLFKSGSVVPDVSGGDDRFVETSDLSNDDRIVGTSDVSGDDNR